MDLKWSLNDQTIATPGQGGQEIIQNRRAAFGRPLVGSYFVGVTVSSVFKLYLCNISLDSEGLNTVFCSLKLICLFSLKFVANIKKTNIKKMISIKGIILILRFLFEEYLPHPLLRFLLW